MVVEFVEADGFGPCGGHHFDGERDEAEGDVTFPMVDAMVLLFSRESGWPDAK